MPPERRGRGDGLKKPFGRCRATLDVDVLHCLAAEPLAQALQEPGAAGAASSEQYRNS
jgi:hypothetical protein